MPSMLLLFSALRYEHIKPGPVLFEPLFHPGRISLPNTGVIFCIGGINF